jgi:hypothetical protein
MSNTAIRTHTQAPRKESQFVFFSSDQAKEIEAEIPLVLGLLPSSYNTVTGLCRVMCNK